MQGSISIPNAIGPLVITADLRAGQVTCHADVTAPKDGRPTTRVNWLVRQLRHAPDSVRLEAFSLHSRGPGTAELLKNIREQPALLIEDPHKELRSFRVALGSPLGTKRGRGRGSFIDSVENAINMFYRDVLQDIRAWTATPPRLRETPELPDERPSLASTALSSQDGQESDPPTPIADDQLDEVDEGPEAGPVEDLADEAPAIAHPVPDLAVLSEASLDEATPENSLESGVVD